MLLRTIVGRMTRAELSKETLMTDFTQVQSQWFDLIRKAGEEQLTKIGHVAEEAAKIESTLIQTANSAVVPA